MELVSVRNGRMKGMVFQEADSVGGTGEIPEDRGWGQIGRGKEGDREDETAATALPC